MSDNKICVVGWHFYSKIYEQLSKSKYDVHIVAHRYNKILDDLNLSYTVTKNEGLEFGAYNWYIKNVWDKESNVIFMHDDIEMKSRSVLSKIFYKCKQKKVDQGYIFGNYGIGPHGRCIYSSSSFITKIQEDYDGIYYDKSNIGYIKEKNQPEGWHKKRYNFGIYKFSKMSLNIGKKYNKKVEKSLNFKGMNQGDRGRL